ncbi:MAG: response regulator transcription factor [Myxococcota bacterium]
MPAVVLIDDDPSLLDVLGLAFEDAGYAVTTAPDGSEGLARIREAAPDVVVSDVNMPRIDGYALCRTLRQEGNLVPLVLLTSRDSEIDEALGLELGADDFVTKPFSTRILLARVAALVRREQLRQRKSSTPEPRRIGKLSLDGERLEVQWDGQPLVVTVTEFRLLEVLVERPGFVLSRSVILDRLRGDTVVAERIVDTYVRRLRRKLQSIDPGFSHIETVVGAGYRWTEG